MEGPSKAQVADILEKAADLYESEQIDWCQGQLYLSGGPSRTLSACAMGAIYLASGYKVHVNQWVKTTTVADPSLYNKVLLAGDALARFLDPGDESLYPVAGWNDARGRTKEEVIQAMKECAKDLRNKA